MRVTVTVPILLLFIILGVGLTGIWAFVVIPWFFGRMPRNLFFFTFFFLSTFWGFLITHLANIRMHQKSTMRVAVIESFWRKAIGLFIGAGIGLLVLLIFIVTGG